MKIKTKKTLGSILGLTGFVSSLIAGSPPDSTEIGQTKLDSIQQSFYEAQLDTSIKTNYQIDSVYLEMNGENGQIKEIPIVGGKGVEFDSKKELEKIDADTTDTDTSDIDLQNQSLLLEDNYDSHNRKLEKIEASGNFSSIIANGLERATEEKILSNVNILKTDITLIPSIVVDADTVKLKTVYLDADTVKAPLVILDADTLKLDDVIMQGDTTWQSDVTIPGKKIQLPPVYLDADTVQAPTVVLRDTLTHKNIQPSKKPLTIMPVNTTVVDTITVDKQKTMVQNIKDYIIGATDKYLNSDARLSAKMNKNLKGLEESLGASKTFTDDNFIGVMSNLDSLGNNLAEILLSDNMPSGTAVADQVNNIVNDLQDFDLQYTDYLKQAEAGLKNFNKQYKMANTLSTVLQARVNIQKANVEERIVRLDSALVKVKSLIKDGKKIKKAKGIGDKQHEFKYSGDEDSQKVVEFFQNQYDSTKASLSPELFQSWKNDFYNPQLNQVIDLYEDILDKRYVNPSRLEKINKQYDGILDSNLIHSISEERKNLQNSLKDLKGIKKDQKKSKIKFEIPKINFPKWKKQDVSISAGGSFGGVQSLRTGVEYGPVGLNIEGGLSPYSRIILDSTTTPNFLGTSAHLSNKDKDFKYIGFSGEAHLGPAFLGVGANYWMYNKEIIEDIKKGNEVIIPNRNTYAKNEVSSNIFGGIRVPILDKVSMDLSAGYDSQKGGYLGLDFVNHFGDNRGNKGSKSNKK